MKNLFVNYLYVKVYENKLEVKNVSVKGGWVSGYPDKPFSTERLLVGTFSAAEPALRKLFKDSLPNGWVKKNAKVVIHPIDKVEGGLSEVEEKILKELAFGAGALKVALHVGDELTGSEVVKLINDL